MKIKSYIQDVILKVKVKKLSEKQNNLKMMDNKKIAKILIKDLMKVYES